MNLIKFILIIYLAINSITKLYGDEHKAGTKFIVAGHLYPITKDLKKKKVWIKNNIDEDSDSVEIEVEIYDLANYCIHFYDKKGKLILYKKEKHQLNILV